MSSQNDIQQSYLWTLVNLIEELEEINTQLNDISLGFDTGEIDFAGFEQVMLQLRDCQGQLAEILDEQQPTRPVF